MFFVIHLHAGPVINTLPPIMDPDPLLTCDLMDGRDAFLTLARDKHWEFSSLRRCKWSTMCMLVELHNQGQDRFVYTCNECKHHVETRWHCTVCEVGSNANLPTCFELHSPSYTACSRRKYRAVILPLRSLEKVQSRIGGQSCLTFKPVVEVVTAPYQRLCKRDSRQDHRQDTLQTRVKCHTMADTVVFYAMSIKPVLLPQCWHDI